ncbi:hypothetical protein KDH_00260 [Dictyobacter sp. S3.2.2.5]|uniref:Uncharacterized protein n=1 Tax=Dictyobacter halimunensis TaxID=3026934 RepID=A0ABQ6FKW4_9CHLR|nr:hypothetical protein KDH_00070 [Dictyobacter sp. S3.2.2.5]GLV53171.1 hypothetical protein KDH_00260 [Dictyobacter sp. S3.2.2.5]
MDKAAKTALSSDTIFFLKSLILSACWLVLSLEVLRTSYLREESVEKERRERRGKRLSRGASDGRREPSEGDAVYMQRDDECTWRKMERMFSGE